MSESSQARVLPPWAPGAGLMCVIAAVGWGLAEVETRALGNPLIEALVLSLLIGVWVRNVMGDGSKTYTAGPSSSTRVRFTSVATFPESSLTGKAAATTCGTA